MIARPRIRPLGLGELLDESFRLYRNYFVILVAVAAVVMVPYALLGLLVQIPVQDQIEAIQRQAAAGVDPLGDGSIWDFFGKLAFTVLGSLALSMLYTLLLQPLMEGALARGASQGYLDRAVSIGDSFSTSLRHILGLIGARLIPALIVSLGSGMVLAISVGSLALFGINAAQSDPNDLSNLGTALGLVFCIFGLSIVLAIAALLIFVRLIFSVQAVVVEGRGPWAAVKRSWQLTTGYFWRTLGYVLVISLLVFLIAAIPALVVTLPVQFLLPDQFRLQTVISAVVNTLLNVFVTPFGLIAYTLMYYDLRIRKEGFDLEQQTALMRQSESGVAPLTR